jgi:predicted nucleic acid-binding protein
MIVISNTTPLIGVSILGRFDLLKQLFGEIIIPTAVYDELTGKGSGRVGAAEVAEGVAAGWIHVENISSTPLLITLQVDLDAGESEAIALALEKHSDLLLLDERRGRGKAKALGLEITGTIGILLLAREKGIELDMRLELEKLRTHGFRISDSLFKQIIQSSKKN